MRTSLNLAACLVTASYLAMSTASMAGAETVNEPVLAELFTSQSCSSCPAAERLFNKLAQTDGVVAIQWHVDYWDNLVHGRAGKWKDPFSSAYHTARQRDYNYALRGTRSVYTPQAVIGGVLETTGSRTKRITKMIASAPAAEAAIDFEQSSDGYKINVRPLSKGGERVEAETMLVMLITENQTEILGGENKGRSAKSLNIAMSSDTLGPWTGTSETYRADLMPEGYSCAVIVQEKAKGRVLGASYCPN